MKITYLGHSCFCMENEKGTRIITDPYTKVGYELPSSLQADLITVSHGHFDHAYTAVIEGATAILSKEGEYIFEDIQIVGKHTWHDPKQGALRGDNIIFSFVIDGLRVCHFGDLGEGYNEKIAKILEGADVWLIPVGGTYTIDAKQAKEYVDKLTPKAVIPMHYRPADGKLDIAPISEFLQMFTSKDVFPCPTGEIALVKEELLDGQTRIIYMERK